jgi:2'-5' RNA ligase
MSRVRQTPLTRSRPDQTRAKLADYDAGAMGVDEVTVYASELGREGPTYHVLARAPLS